MTTNSKTESTAKKDVSKLQRAIVDGLEDIKAQDIQVFDTEHLTALFERVIVASGTSNRQTKAIAASVRDKVREAGFPKPRIEGEENGEWIIVDCGAAVAHIMQPTIRQYYRLEELWGDTPVRMKIGAPKPAAPAAAKVPVKTAARRAAKAEAESAAMSDTPTAPKKAAAAQKTVAAKKPAARKTTSRAPVDVAPTTAPAAKKSAARKTPSAVPAAKTAAKAPAKTAAKTAVKTPSKTPIKTVVVKPRAEKVPAKKTTVRAPAKTGAKAAPAKTTARKPAAGRKP
ncbi:ribosome silencing factor [Simplicispira psychrophila]|uniref:ribosome silencing factor n=1 Tax=Simplicispira psychrophila TaxID=80882 RepID=UPI000488F8C8|nr:ribosome silencing factor [Simplicispira psychrophila]